MKLPLQITFRHIDHSDAIERDIRKHAEKLDTYYPNVISCRVVFDAPHQHKHKGNLYLVNIDVKVSGGEIAVHSESDKNHAHEDAYVAIRDAFEAMYKKLKNLSQKRQGQVKHHEEPSSGKIKLLDPDKGFGMIETNDGREIYFHRNSVINEKFESLNVGHPVRFHEELGEQGPQASSVILTSS